MHMFFTQACASLDLLELLATSVLLPVRTGEDPLRFQLSIAFLSRLAMLLVRFCEQASAMACDAWSWLRMEQAKELMQAPAAGHSQIPPKVCQTFALLSAANFCTSDCAHLSFNYGWISALADSIYEDIIGHHRSRDSHPFSQMLIDETVALGEHPSHGLRVPKGAP